MREEKGVIPSYGFLKWLADKHNFDLYAEHGAYLESNGMVGIMIDLSDMIRYTAEFFGVSAEDIKSKSRKREFVIPRQFCFKLLRDNTNITLGDIGLAFGGRDHSTVIHGSDTISDLIEVDKSIKMNYDNFTKYMGAKIENSGNSNDKEKKSLQRMSDRTIYLVGGKVLKVCKPKQDPFIKKEEAEPQRAKVS